MAGRVGLTCSPPSFSSVKYKRVNKYGFSTPGSEATVFEKTSRLDEGKAPSCVYVPATVILVLENSSAKEASLSGKGWDKDLRMEMEMKIGRPPELLGVGWGSRGGEGCCGAPGVLGELEADYLQGGAQQKLQGTLGISREESSLCLLDSHLSQSHGPSHTLGQPAVSENQGPQTSQLVPFPETTPINS